MHRGQPERRCCLDRLSQNKLAEHRQEGGQQSERFAAGFHEPWLARLRLRKKRRAGGVENYQT